MGWAGRYFLAGPRTRGPGPRISCNVVYSQQCTCGVRCRWLSSTAAAAEVPDGVPDVGVGTRQARVRTYRQGRSDYCDTRATYRRVHQHQSPEINPHLVYKTAIIV
ncbi:hypothetical protein J6590_042498 [Homalodisca vitripennis]|nr:hypothetical protein J6590_042498 [Homalodisca vitripennis]